MTWSKRFTSYLQPFYLIFNPIILNADWCEYMWRALPKLAWAPLQQCDQFVATWSIRYIYLYHTHALDDVNLIATSGTNIFYHSLAQLLNKYIIIKLTTFSASLKKLTLSEAYLTRVDVICHVDALKARAPTESLSDDEILINAECWYLLSAKSYRSRLSAFFDRRNFWYFSRPSAVVCTRRSLEKCKYNDPTWEQLAVNLSYQSQRRRLMAQMLHNLIISRMRLQLFPPSKMR